MARRRDGGCAFVENPALDCHDATLFWRNDANPAVVEVDVLPARPADPDALILARLGVGATILVEPGGHEQLLLKQALRQVSLSVRDGSLLEQPIRLRYVLEGLRTLDAKLLTLRRLLALCRLGRFPAGLFPQERRARRWILLLRTIDGLAAGASQRDLAAGLFGVGAAADWRAGSDFMRLRVKRLSRTANGLVSGGFRQLL